MLESEAEEQLSRRWIVYRICVCLGLLFGMLFSWQLWLSDGREFPVLPCLGLGKLSAPFDWILLLGTLALAGGAIARVWDRWIVAGLAVLLVVLGLLDQMRWQPWAYQYLLCFIPMAFVAQRSDREGIAAVLDLGRLLIIATYVWSGIHKFGVQFQRTYRSDVVDNWLESTSGWLHELIVWNGYLVPWVEILIGLGLLLPWTRQLAIYLAIGTHAFILVTLGPLGAGSNSVIWPWNLGMVGIVLALFWRLRGFALVDLFSVRRLQPVAVVIGVLVVLMPARSVSGKWHQYFSFHLYSGHHQRLSLMVSNQRAAQIEAIYTEIMTVATPQPGQDPTHRELSIGNWSYRELNVPMPSENRILLGVAKELVERFDLGPADYFYRDYPELLRERGYDVYSPTKIRGMGKFPPFRQQLSAQQIEQLDQAAKRR